MAGYTRNDTSNNIADGNIINASDLDGEFDAIQTAFGTSGHTHDGTAGNGPQIGNGGIANLAVTDGKIANNTITGSKINTATTITAASFVGPLSGNASTASKLQTARNIALTGAVTGSVNFDGSGNVSIATTHTADPTVTLTGAVTGSGTMTNLGSVSIATTATADPTLTLAGDVTGSATFTNLGNATLTATVANDSHTHDGRYYTESEADSRFVNTAGDTMTGNLTVDAGTNTTLTVLSDNTGKSEIALYGSSQGTGRLYVGQSTTHGGGIEYNGDNSPSTTGAGSDYVTLWNRNAGVDAWTARNQYSSYNWEFRGNLYANTNQRVFADDYHPNADKWTTARQNTVTLTGDVTGTGNASVDGSGDWTVSLTTTVANDSHTHSNYVLKAGDTMSGNLNFNDNVKAVFGAGSDLEIYHDGSNSIIRDTGTGNLKIQANNFELKQYAADETYLTATANGAVSLYYDNSSKLQTISTGINVSGDINTVTNIYLDNQIISVGDTNTYLQFHAADQWRVVTGGSERLEVNNSYVTINNAQLDVNSNILVSGVVGDTTTGALRTPVGTTAQRPTGVTGMVRYNSTDSTFEGYNGSAWGSIGGGATGGSGNAAFWENDTTISASYTITSGKNAGTFGPVTIADGVTVTVPDGSTWTIV